MPYGTAIVFNTSLITRQNKPPFQKDGRKLCVFIFDDKQQRGYCGLHIHQILTLQLLPVRADERFKCIVINARTDYPRGWEGVCSACHVFTPTSRTLMYNVQCNCEV
jgi:hypothetical protein